jgi:hypothetical protein
MEQSIVEEVEVEVEEVMEFVVKVGLVLLL